MKRLTAILLLGIFSFNLFGYRLIASFLESRENKKMELALDKSDYSDEQLISIKQAINLPYYQNSQAFQRIDGEIEIAGILYKYVKCRIYNDSLELLCIPNTGKMKIQAAKADFSKLSSDFQQSDSKKKSSSESRSFQKSMSEYEEYQAAVSDKFNPLSLEHLIKNQRFPNNLFNRSIEQPPDAPAVISWPEFSKLPHLVLLRYYMYSIQVACCVVNAITSYRQLLFIYSFLLWKNYCL